MKQKIIILISILVLVLLGLWIGVKSGNYLAKSNSPAAKTPVVEQPVPPSVSILHRSEIPRPGVPQTLIISSIGVQTSVEQVGLDSQKRMDVPKDVNNVGWYKLGFRPGESGNSVIAGHFDSPNGPAVFWNLSKLVPGDKITIIDDQNKKYDFKVTSKATYPFDKLPLQQIFGESDKPHLNLITCSGIWDVGDRNYSNRVVVYSDLIEKSLTLNRSLFN